MIRIKVPGTSANLGPGFDSIGMALSVYNEVTVEETDSPLMIVSSDSLVPKDKTNLIYTTIEEFYKLTNSGKVPNIKITQNDNIPMARGLGSSAACIVAGLFAGNYLAKTNLSKDEIVNMAAIIEGHPDNSTPAIVGGITVGVIENDELSYIKLDTAKFQDLSVIVMTPDFHLKTNEARSILPVTYPIKDVVYNISRVALLIAAITSGDFDKLNVATSDKLHQPYRMSMINNMENIFEKSKSFGAVATFLSGAGPTLISFAKDDSLLSKMDEYVKTLDDNWIISKIDLDLDGTQIVVEV